MDTSTAGAGVGGVLIAGVISMAGMWQQATGHKAEIKANSNQYTVIIEALKEGTKRQHDEAQEASRRYEALMANQAADSQQSYKALLAMCVPK